MGEIHRVKRGLKKRAKAAPVGIPLAPGEDPEADARHAARFQDIIRGLKAAKPKRPMDYTRLRETHKRDFRTGRVEKRVRV